MNGDGDVVGHVQSIDNKHKDSFYKDQLDELEKENLQLKSMKDSLQNHLNFLMKKIRHIKLAKSEDLSEEEHVETAGIRFSITESIGRSSRCYTALFDSLEDFSISKANDEFLLAEMDRLSSDSSDSYIDLNAYNRCSPPDQPPQVHISRKRMLSPIHDADVTSNTFSFSQLSHFNEPIMLPEDLKGSVLSPEIVIKSPRRSNRINRSRARVTDISSISSPASPDAVWKTPDSCMYYTINIPETPLSSQASPMDIIRSYHSAQDREQVTVRATNDLTENPWAQTLNPIAELVQHLPFYTCVRGVPRLAKETAVKVSTTTSLPSGSSSSFEVGESVLHPFNTNPKVNTKSPLDTEEPQVDSNYSELPSKTNNGEHECESNVSMEYCLPPEEGSTCSNMRSTERPQYCAGTSSKAMQSAHEKQVLKKGVLRKLNKKFKVWSNFFCILTNKGLFFYHIKHQQQNANPFSIQKPVKEIEVEIMERIDFIKSDRSVSDFYLGNFEIVSTCDKRYTLATGDRNDCRDWIRALRSVILQHKACIIMQSNTNQLLHKGWVTRVKWGCSKKLWCCLMGRYLVYFNTKYDYFPTGYRNLANCIVNTNTSFSKNSHNEYNSVGSEISDSLDYPEVFFTISICQENSTPIFLCIETEQELRTWSHYLKVSIMNNRSEDVESDRGVCFAELIRPEYNDRFYYTTGDIYHPVSINTSTLLTTGAFQIWKALQRLTSLEHFCTRKDIIKEKFDRIKFLIFSCIQEPGLKDEMYLQLMKQSHRSIHRDPKTYQSRRSKFSLFCGGDNLVNSGSSIHDPRMTSIREAEVNAILNMWECLAILIPIFLPSPSVCAVLRRYLVVSKDTNAESDKEVSDYAAYCLDQLNHVKEVSGRLRPPSQFEVTAMSTRNPYTHSLPFSLPVYIQSESYHVISFSPLSSIQMVTESMVRTMLPPESLDIVNEVCLFGVYLYQPYALNKYTFLNPDSKICDVISKYEEYLNAKRPEPSLNDPSRVIKFFLRIQALKYNKFVDWYCQSPALCLDVLKMLCHQIHSSVKQGHYSLSGAQLLILMTYLFTGCNSESSEFWQTDTALSQLVCDLLPSSLSRSSDNIEYMKSLIIARLKHQRSNDSYFQYVLYIKDICDHQWSPSVITCVATHNSDCLPGQQLIIVCQEASISFLDYKCRICLKKIPIGDILSFGSSSHHFLIAYSLLPARQCFKRIIFFVPDHLCSLELCSTIVFYSSKSKSQDTQILL